MRVLYTTENIFDIPTKSTDAVCITTNGIIKQNGFAVMGAGIAKEADIRFKLSKELANHLRENGNIPHLFSKTAENGYRLISLPTKNHWRDPSDLNLIRNSCQILVRICDRFGIERCYLTPPGCGLGQLNWTDVRHVIKDILDDRFIVVVRKPLSNP